MTINYVEFKKKRTHSNMNNQEDIEKLHKDLEVGHALQRLESNPDFDLVIRQMYVMHTLVSESQNMTDIQPPIRQEALEKVMSVNYFRQRLSELKSAAMSAEEALNSED
jgi:hypothetical protein